MRQSFGVILTFVRHSSTKWFPFDTHEMVKQLQDAGYSTAQAEAVTSLLSTTVGSVREEITTQSVSKLEQLFQCRKYFQLSYMPVLMVYGKIWLY
jgi:hypothetical protein